MLQHGKEDTGLEQQVTNLWRIKSSEIPLDFKLKKGALRIYPKGKKHVFRATRCLFWNRDVSPGPVDLNNFQLMAGNVKVPCARVGIGNSAIQELGIFGVKDECNDTLSMGSEGSRRVGIWMWISQCLFLYLSASYPPLMRGGGGFRELLGVHQGLKYTYGVTPCLQEVKYFQMSPMLQLGYHRHILAQNFTWH